MKSYTVLTVMVAISFILITSFSSAQSQVLKVDIWVSINDSAELRDYEVIQGSPYPQKEGGDYRLVIEDGTGSEIWSTYRSIDFFVFDVNKFINETVHHDKIPYYPETSRIKFYHNGNLILDEKLDFCNEDGTCEDNENHLNCPSDCPLDEKDGYCLSKEDGVCDPDCIGDADPDCIEPECGDGNCDEDEDYTSCPQDCPRPVECGDGRCEGEETVESCPQDCRQAGDQGIIFTYLGIFAVLVLILVLLILRKKRKSSSEGSEWDEVYDEYR